MSRYVTIPSGNGSVNPSASVLDVPAGVIVGADISNPSAVDIYVSEDRTRLDNTAQGTNLPQVGRYLPAAAPPQPIAVMKITRVVGPYKLYARASGLGAQLEVIEYPTC